MIPIKSISRDQSVAESNPLNLPSSTSATRIFSTETVRVDSKISPQTQTLDLVPIHGMNSN